MAKDSRLLHFPEAKGDTVENLEAIKLSLALCIDEGIIDEEDTLYNKILLLEDEADLSDSWDELMAVIEKAKTLENDVAVFLSNHGRTSVSLPWPRRPQP